MAQISLVMKCIDCGTPAQPLVEGCQQPSEACACPSCGGSRMVPERDEMAMRPPTACCYGNNVTLLFGHTTCPSCGKPL